jgi:hypothetical protein
MSNPITDFLGGLIFDSQGKLDPKKLALSGAGLAALYGVTNRDSGIGKFLTGGTQRPVGYSEGIPEYGIARALVPDAFSTTTPTGEPRRPGSGGRRYFTDTTYTPTGKTMSSAINPVTVPPQTRAPITPTTPTKPADGLFGALTPEQAAVLFRNLFGGGGGTNTGGGGIPLTMDDTNMEEFAQGGAVPASRGYYLGGSTDGMADEIPATIEDTQPAALSDGEFVVPADVVSGLGNGNSDAGAKVLYSMMDRVRQARTGTKEQGRKIAPNKFTPA